MCCSDGTFARAAVPSGASTGTSFHYQSAFSFCCGYCLAILIVCIFRQYIVISWFPKKVVVISWMSVN